jgi:hypothetical protein
VSKQQPCRAFGKKSKTAGDQTGMSFDSIQVLVSLEESVTHHLDKISLSAEQHRKVLSSEFLTVFTH